MIDATHWNRLRGMDPQDVVARSLAGYDGEAGAYRLRILTDGLLIHPAEETITWADAGRREGKPPGFHHWLVAVVYLVSSSARPPVGEWVGPNSLPYGEFFFRGPHALPSGDIVDAFGDRPDRFARAARSLGGKPWAQGRNAFDLPALPRVPVMVQFWEKDDEFPARAGFLFDRATCDHLAVDALFSLVIIVTKRLVEAGKTE